MKTAFVAPLALALFLAGCTTAARIDDSALPQTPAAFKEAESPLFRRYQERVLENARAMAATLAARGLRIVSGGTDCHMFLVDLRAKSITGRDAEAALGRAHITVNKNAIPNDPEKPTVTSGIRLGSAAMTTRGFGVSESRTVANLIADVLQAPGDELGLERAAQQVRALCSAFPVYRSSKNEATLSFTAR